jgi:hypothetical protein
MIHLALTTHPIQAKTRIQVTLTQRLCPSFFLPRLRLSLETILLTLPRLTTLPTSRRIHHMTVTHTMENIPSWITHRHYRDILNHLETRGNRGLVNLQRRRDELQNLC